MEYIHRIPDTIIPSRNGLYSGVINRDVAGAGYLGGDHPEGVVKVDGIPSVAEVRILLRTVGVSDGLLVAKTMSNPDGTWRISGLNPTLKYDIAVRKDGFNDIVWSDMTPEVEE